MAVPSCTLGSCEHVEHSTRDGLDGNGLAGRERNHGLYATESGLHLLEAGVRRDHEVVHFLELRFDLGLPVRRQLRVLEERPPERTLGVEVPGRVPERPEIEEANLLLQDGERSAVRAAQRFAVEVQEGPVVRELPRPPIVPACDSQPDMPPSVVVNLEHFGTVQSPNKVVVPFLAGPLRESDLDLDGVRRRRLGVDIGQMEVQCPDGLAPGTEFPKAQLQGIENRRLPAVVLADQNRDPTQLEVEASDSAKVPDANFFDRHSKGVNLQAGRRTGSRRGSGCFPPM
ncbi:MAG: hypothetical protein OXU64_02160 [Gemmatimonadota bacterium]|nr:hypothetical protein [Gemmatimonadota bacterium]